MSRIAIETTTARGGWRWLLKPAVFIVALAPVAILILEAVTMGLGANPVETITEWSGQWTLRFLLITLAITPLRRLSGWAWPLRIRRMLGLYTFFYGSIHFLAFIWFDHDFALTDVWLDVIEKPFVTVGFIAWTLLLVLAATSNGFMLRLLGRRWQLLHRAVYTITVCALLHHFWSLKTIEVLPVVYLLLALALLSLRMAYLIRGR